jgi:zincin-like metallopeptidase toxin 3 of polymorphic toxin system
VADKYESGDGWVIWEATVLHELIHWARLKERLKDGNLEPGQEFEMEAYGEHIELTTQWRPGP